MNWRSPKLLRAARDCPHCMCCGKHNDGTIVAAHSNQLRDGKGKGLKAHDYRIAYICRVCHNEIDQGKGSRELRQNAWEESHRRTVAHWFESGLLWRLDDY